MDYERKYKEALKKAKSIHSLLKDSDDSKNFSYVETIEDIFPELCESEEERIRKWLIGVIKSNEYGSISNVGEMPCPKPNVIAWLEKQVEKKSVWSEEDEKILNEFIESLRYCNGDGYNKQVDWLKSLKERMKENKMEWISTKIRFPKSGEEVITACKNKNMENGIWLYDLCYYRSDSGWENRLNWEDVLYWTYIDEPTEN